MGAHITIDRQFLDLVTDMRRQQRACFDPKNAHRKESLFKSCKTIERQVDAYLDQIQHTYAALENARHYALDT